MGSVIEDLLDVQQAGSFSLKNFPSRQELINKQKRREKHFPKETKFITLRQLLN